MPGSSKKMTNPLTAFGESAQTLARNPLGIIALFIVLVYGIAALLFGFSAGKLNANDQRMIIGFLVGFPILVLIAFYRLVTNHHTKLYAPYDFPEKDGFFRLLTTTER